MYITTHAIVKNMRLSSFNVAHHSTKKEFRFHVDVFLEPYQNLNCKSVVLNKCKVCILIKTLKGRLMNEQILKLLSFGVVPQQSSVYQLGSDNVLVLYPVTVVVSTNASSDCTLQCTLLQLHYFPVDDSCLATGWNPFCDAATLAVVVTVCQRKK